MPNYLDTTAKVYSYRIENCTKDVSILIDNVKIKPLTNKESDEQHSLTTFSTKVITSKTVIILW